MKASIWFGLLMLASASGFACSCANYEPIRACEVFHKTQIVFRGRVIDHNDDSRLGFVQWTLYRFRVEEVFKGLRPAIKEVFIDPGSFTSCYGRFSSERDYLIYIYTGNSQPPEPFFSYYARFRDTKSCDGSVKPLPPAWKNLGTTPVFSVWECSPSRTVEENDPDLSYLRQAAREKLSTTGFLQGMAAQNASWPYSFRDFLPVAGANVIAKSGNRIWRATTNADGSYLIDSVPPGTYTVALTSTRFGTAKILMDNPSVEVPAGACATARASFITTSTIAGTVQNAEGKPAKDIRIEVGEIRMAAR